MTLSIKKNLEEVQKNMSYVSDHLPKAPILFDINDSLKTVNELSKGLGLAIADKGLAENYNKIFEPLEEEETFIPEIKKSSTNLLCS